jgi:cytochrome c553
MMGARSTNGATPHGVAPFFGAMAALAAWAFPAAALAQAPDLERAKQIVGGSCFLCHGADGESSSEVFPKLGGQNAEYLAKQLANFKSGTRKSPSMGGMVKDLTPQDIASLGAYFAAKPGTTHEIKDWDLAGVGRYVYLQGNRWAGVAACQSCHGASGHGTTTLPRLAGQNAIYLELQIKQFNTRERTNDNEVMHAIASKMSELEIKAVSEYLSGQP